MDETEFSKYKGKESGYKLPDGYFNTKRNELLSITTEERRSSSKVIRLSFAWVASGIAAILLIGLFIWGPSLQKEVEPNFDFEYEEIAEYVYSSYNYELNEQLLLLEMNEDDLSFSNSSGFEFDDLDDLELIIDESFDQTLNYEYL